jgi:hypothetical protein
MALASDAEYWFLIVIANCVCDVMQILLCYVDSTILNHLVLTENECLAYESELVQLLSDNKPDFTKLNSILKMYIQIRDDYCNLCLQQVTLKLLVLDG